MSVAVLSRAWRGETPYIKSWCDYYLDTLLFDRVIIIRCDEERFDFLDDGRIEFVDSPSASPVEVFGSIVNMEIPRDFDCVFSCDIDEYLILHGKTIKELSGPWDSRFFWWALCCSVSPTTGDLRDCLESGVSVGHDGKTLFKTDMALRFFNEHRPELRPRGETFFEEEGFVKSPYVLHFSSRGLEDLVIRSVWQSIKTETSRSRYVSCLKTPPKDFRHLPVRFKIAYAQTRMKRVPFKCDLPCLPVDADRLSSLFSLTGAPGVQDLFTRDYDISDILDGYPSKFYGTQIDFHEMVGDLEARRPDKTMI